MWCGELSEKGLSRALGWVRWGHDVGWSVWLCHQSPVDGHRCGTAACRELALAFHQSTQEGSWALRHAKTPRSSSERHSPASPPGPVG